VKAKLEAVIQRKMTKSDACGEVVVVVVAQLLNERTGGWNRKFQNARE
jgi:hypothetical protein